MKVFSEIIPLRYARWVDPIKTWGLVPTMGFLHEAHMNLVRRSKNENDRTCVSIFVNPMQFNNPDDLSNYPRKLDQDLAMLEKEGVDLVWTPTPDIVYPVGYQTDINVRELTRVLEGASRPGHFQGVATVVAKLFNVFQPHRSYFGQKDAQQVAVIRQMAKDLNFNIDIIACPTIRETDGLAMSSRNVNLTSEHRQQAVCLFQALSAAKAACHAGETDTNRIKEIMTRTILTASAARIDYVSAADVETLQELTTVEKEALLSLAVFFGNVRLIDNMTVTG
ncbi:MAG: pantoate--beta-alanine ligase [Pseudomonadota bacterium]